MPAQSWGWAENMAATCPPTDRQEGTRLRVQRGLAWPLHVLNEPASLLSSGATGVGSILDCLTPSSPIQSTVTHLHLSSPTSAALAQTLYMPCLALYMTHTHVHLPPALPHFQPSLTLNSRGVLSRAQMPRPASTTVE